MSLVTFVRFRVYASPVFAGLEHVRRRSRGRTWQRDKQNELKCLVIALDSDWVQALRTCCFAQESVIHSERIFYQYTGKRPTWKRSAGSCL
jgi:hypothetical protein